MSNQTKKKNKLFFILLIPIIIIVFVFLAFAIRFIIFNFTYVSPQEEIIQSIGKYECLEYYSNNGFQDYTDYGVYSYDNPKIDEAEDFKPCSDFTQLNEYLDNFENWVYSYSPDIEIRKYNFERSIIDESDYYCIKDKSFEDDFRSQFDSYDIYIFDTQTEKLYYFHQNI